MQQRILPIIQYFAYVEITSGIHQNLWNEYKKIQEQFANEFAMQNVRGSTDIYPVFRELIASKTDLKPWPFNLGTSIFANNFLAFNSD